MKILVTGAHGFAGSHLTELLKEHGHQITAPRINLLNATEVTTAISGKKIDGVIHLAAIATTGASFGSPAKILRNNILAQLNLLQTLRKQKTQARILIICSADEYGRGSDKPIDENSSLMPTSPYAVSKIAQDFMGLQYYLSHQMNIIRVRPFNHIGERQSTGFVTADFAKQIAQIEASGQPGTITVGNLNQTRDFTDVKDMVRAYELALQKGKPGQVYNIGSGHGVKIKDLLYQLINLSKAEITVKVDRTKFRPGESSSLVCNPKKFQLLTKWKPTIPLNDTLKRVLEYWRENV